MAAPRPSPARKEPIQRSSRFDPWANFFTPARPVRGAASPAKPEEEADEPLTILDEAIYGFFVPP